jgi:hypothetical protein
MDIALANLALRLMGKLACGVKCVSILQCAMGAPDPSELATGSWEDGSRSHVSQDGSSKQGAAERETVSETLPRQQRQTGGLETRPIGTGGFVLGNLGCWLLFVLVGGWSDQGTRCGDTLCWLPRIERLQSSRGFDTVGLHTTN